MPFTLGRRSSTVLLLASLAFSPGCALVLQSGMKWKVGDVPTDPDDRKSPLDRFLALQGKRKLRPECLMAFDPDLCPVATAVAPYPLRAPFRVGVTAGVFDPARIEFAESAQFCLEVDDVGDPTPVFGTRFWFVCGRRTAGGIQVFAADADGVIDPQVAQAFYADAEKVDLEIESDTSHWILRSRETGTQDFDVLANVNYDPPEGRYLPSLGGINVFKKGEIGFDGLVHENGPADGLPTEELFAEFASESLRFQHQACDALDGALPDFATAEGKLTAALNPLAVARAQVEALGDTREHRKALKKLDQSQRGLLSAIAKLEKEREKPVLRRIQKAMRKTTDAVLLVRPVKIDF